MAASNNSSFRRRLESSGFIKEDFALAAQGTFFLNWIPACPQDSLSCVYRRADMTKFELLETPLINKI